MQNKRFDELEGLRGIAAVVVVIYHFLLAFYAVMFFGVATGNVQNMRLEDNLYGNPIMAFLSGTFAVAIFFVLSGFVLSIGFFQTGKLEIIKKLATKRYLRLMLPALASVILCFTLFILGVAKIHDVAAITHSSWLASTWAFNPDFFGALKSGVYDIFARQGNPYNNVLWTMVYEFAGSFLVFGFLALFGKLKYRWVIYGFLGFATFNSWFFAFIVGMAIADLYAQGYLTTKNRKMRLVVPLLAISLFMGGYPYASVEGTIYQYISFADTVNWRMIYLTLGASGVMLIILQTEQVARVMRHKFISKLGKYTFALYLVHLAVLYTIGMGVFLILRNVLGVGFNASAVLTIIVSLPVVAGATYLFEKYIDAPSIRLSSYVTGILLGNLPTSDLKLRLGRLYQRVAVLFKPRRQPEVAELVPEEIDAV